MQSGEPRWWMRRVDDDRPQTIVKEEPRDDDQPPLAEAGQTSEEGDNFESASKFYTSRDTTSHCLNRFNAQWRERAKQEWERNSSWDRDLRSSWSTSPGWGSDGWKGLEFFVVLVQALNRSGVKVPAAPIRLHGEVSAR